MRYFAFLTYFILSIAYAGGQKEEHLSFSVQQALSKAIEGSVDVETTYLFSNHIDRNNYILWKHKVNKALQKKIPNDVIRNDFIDSVYYEAKRSALEPELILGLIQVESGFKQYAISNVGARGLMQVMPFWTKTIGNSNSSLLFNMQVNLRYGCTILRHYLNREQGNLFYALGRYNGSRGQPKYPNLVSGAWNRWKSITAD